jgi:hypothetical protein
LILLSGEMPKSMGFIVHLNERVRVNRGGGVRSHQPNTKRWQE